MFARIAMVACLLASATASAQDSDVPIAYDTHGVEVVIPRNWGTIETKDGNTILRPTHFNGRGVEVASLKTMPATRDALYQLAMEDSKGAKLALDSATFVERNGVRAMVAAGKLTVDGMALDIDVVVLPVGAGATA